MPWFGSAYETMPLHAPLPKQPARIWNTPLCAAVTVICDCTPQPSSLNPTWLPLGSNRRRNVSPVPCARPRPPSHVPSVIAWPAMRGTSKFTVLTWAWLVNDALYENEPPVGPATVYATVPLHADEPAQPAWIS